MVSTTERASRGQKLTDPQADVLAKVRQYIADKGYAPAVRDIMRLIDVQSPNGVECHLSALEKKGFIARTKGVARSIRIL